MSRDGPTPDNQGVGESQSGRCSDQPGVTSHRVLHEGSASTASSATEPLRHWVRVVGSHEPLTVGLLLEDVGGKIIAVYDLAGLELQLPSLASQPPLPLIWMLASIIEAVLD